MTPTFYENDAILKTFYATICKGVEVKESSIPGAGLGLFAKKTLKANTITSFYPAHALGMDQEIFLALGEEDTNYFQTNPSPGSPYLHCTDQPIFARESISSSSEPLYLDVNPHRTVVPGWVSQYINDGATVKHKTEEGVINYYRATKCAKNCIHIPFGPSPILATVTTRKVKKGEELFTSYGGVYWLGVDSSDEQQVGITPAIQNEIQETANDLRKSMQSVSVVYQNELEALQQGYDQL